MSSSVAASQNSAQSLAASGKPDIWSRTSGDKFLSLGVRLLWSQCLSTSSWHCGEAGAVFSALATPAVLCTCGQWPLGGWALLRRQGTTICQLMPASHLRLGASVSMGELSLTWISSQAISESAWGLLLPGARKCVYFLSSLQSLILQMIL